MEDQHFSYRNLVVWQKAMQFSRFVYAFVKLFPAEEKYALGDQLRRAAVSIASNIAEGAGRASNKDYAHFLAMARGSLYETMTQLELAESIGYLNEEVRVDSRSWRKDEIFSLAAEISRMLTTLMKKYGALHSPAPTPHSN